jgi:hypothetical protein
MTRIDGTQQVWCFHADSRSEFSDANCTNDLSKCLLKSVFFFDSGH